jgi:hypothetical protein
MQSAPHWTTTASGQYADQILLAMLVNNTKKNIFQQNNLIFGIDHDQKQKGGLLFLDALRVFMAVIFKNSECRTPAPIVISPLWRSHVFFLDI